MAPQTKVILLTNDDGIQAPGIQILKSVLEKQYTVYTIAPLDQMSATAHSLSLFKPIKAKAYDTHSIAVTGSPADCVNFGVLHYLKELHIDLVISGINNGPNMGDDLNYSGTFAGAAEAALFNIDAVAVSVNCINEKCRYEAAAEFMPRLVSWIFNTRGKRRLQRYKGRGQWQDQPLLLNVNVPNLPVEQIKGIKWTKIGKRIYEDVIEMKKNGSSEEYWIIGKKLSGILEDNSDIKAVLDGYISLTPVQLDFTDYNMLEQLKDEKI